MTTNSLMGSSPVLINYGPFTCSPVHSLVSLLLTFIWFGLRRAVTWQRWARVGGESLNHLLAASSLPDYSEKLLLITMQTQWYAWTCGSWRSFIQQSHSCSETPWSLQTQAKQNDFSLPFSLGHSIAEASPPTHFPDTAHSYSFCHPRFLSRTPERYFQSPPRLVSMTPRKLKLNMAKKELSSAPFSPPNGWHSLAFANNGQPFTLSPKLETRESTPLPPSKLLSTPNNQSSQISPK